jgi:hypothetical protein
MSHTGHVFETQYQTSRIRGDLMQAAFGQRTGSDDGPLFMLMRNMSLSRDQNAPIDLTESELAEFDRRQDATTLREAMAEARSRDDETFYGTLNSRLKYLRRSWKSLKLADKRRRYFEEADRSRAQGVQPPRDSRDRSNLSTAMRSHVSNAPLADQIHRHFLRKWNASGEDDDPGRFVRLLVAYLSGDTKAQLDEWEEDGEEELDEKKAGQAYRGDGKLAAEECEGDVVDHHSFVCVICNLSYSSRKTLTSHYERHIKMGMFNQPLSCPECRRHGERVSVEGFMAWLNHLERFHGKLYTPYFPQGRSYLDKYPCPFSYCGTHKKGKKLDFRGLAHHLGHCHADDLHPDDLGGDKDRFKDAVRCFRCASQNAGEAEPPFIAGLWDWRRHFDQEHRSDLHRVYQCFLCPETFLSTRALKIHFFRQHETRDNCFARPFQCPECVTTGHPDPPSITGREAWQRHVDKCHDGGVKDKQVDVDVDVASPHLHTRHLCLICQKGHHSREALDRHLDRSHAKLFIEPFRCPECTRQDNGETEFFHDKSTWILHVDRQHPNDCAISDLELAAPPKCQRAKRKRGGKRPRLPRSRGSSTTSTTSGVCRSPIWDLSSDESLEPDTAESDPDGTYVPRLERKSKRLRGKCDLGAGLEESQRCQEAESIPIDPRLLEIK